MERPRIEDTKEALKLPEIPNTDWETLIIMQRHGKYNKRPPEKIEAIPKEEEEEIKKKTGKVMWLKDLTEEEEKTLGRLTEEGKEGIRKRTRERIDAILEKDPEHTDFLILNSPTFWFDDERLGQRARETAEVVAEELKKELEERNLSESQFLNLSARPMGEPAFEGGVSRPDKRLVEAKMFQVMEFADFLRGLGKEWFKHAISRDTYKEKREKLGAEGPVEIADRANEFLNIIARFAQMYHKMHKGRKVVPWIVTHGEVLEAFTTRVLGAPERPEVGYNDGLGIAIDKEGHVNTEVEGKKYDVEFPKQGKPKKLSKK